MANFNNLPLSNEAFLGPCPYEFCDSPWIPKRPVLSPFYATRKISRFEASFWFI